ncbi:MAG: type II secretion system protein [Planctomycetota bacterium]
MHRQMRTAFTLVELVMVIVIIGLLAAVVIPRFGDMRSEAQNAAETGAVSAVQSGVKLAYMTELAKGNGAYPSALDSATNGAASSTNPLFTSVIDGGVTDPNWEKTGANAYKYKPTTHAYTYTPATGTFARS